MTPDDIDLDPYPDEDRIDYREPRPEEPAYIYQDGKLEVY